MSEIEHNKAVVRRVVEEVFNGGQLGVVDELFADEMAAGVRAWIGPFREAFPDVRMEVLDLIAEGDKVVARFTCSGAHEGEWCGHPPTGRRFERVDEVYFFTVRDGRVAGSWGLEDTLARLRQLGLPAA